MSDLVHRVRVQIVGAGPAGLSAALAARALGAEVVVYEKRHDVGGRFHGDFQGLENWSQEQDVLAELEQLGIGTEFAHTPISEFICFDAAGASYRLASAHPIFYLVRRGTDPGTLDQRLKGQALAAGVTIRFDDRRQQLDGPGIVAEGPHRADVIAAGYVFATDMANGCYGAVSDRLAPAGYSYLLVNDGAGTVATCLFRDFHRERLYLERTVEFFREHAGLNWRTARRFGGSGNYGRVRTVTSGPHLYAGEAAGFQDALFGFGLRYALVSGCLAGRAHARGRNPEIVSAWRARLLSLNAAGVANRWLYSRLGHIGRQIFLARAVAARDPRRLLNRLYRPARWKSILAHLSPSKPLLRQDRVSSDCDCTWCRCQREPRAAGGVD